MGIAVTFPFVSCGKVRARRRVDDAACRRVPVPPLPRTPVFGSGGL